MQPTLHFSLRHTYSSLSHCHTTTVGKLHCRPLAATSPADSSTTSHLFLHHRPSYWYSFAFDTGDDVSGLPPFATKKCTPASMILQAVNTSAISTVGEKSMTLDIGFCRSFRWIFIIADFPIPTLGADFLTHFGL